MTTSYNDAVTACRSHGFTIISTLEEVRKAKQVVIQCPNKSHQPIIFPPRQLTFWMKGKVPICPKCEKDKIYRDVQIRVRAKDQELITSLEEFIGVDKITVRCKCGHCRTTQLGGIERGLGGCTKCRSEYYMLLKTINMTSSVTVTENLPATVLEQVRKLQAEYEATASKLPKPDLPHQYVENARSRFGPTRPIPLSDEQIEKLCRYTYEHTTKKSWSCTKLPFVKRCTINLDDYVVGSMAVKAASANPDSPKSKAELAAIKPKGVSAEIKEKNLTDALGEIMSPHGVSIYTAAHFTKADCGIGLKEDFEKAVPLTTAIVNAGCTALVTPAHIATSTRSVKFETQSAKFLLNKKVQAIEATINKHQVAMHVLQLNMGNQTRTCVLLLATPAALNAYKEGFGVKDAWYPYMTWAGGVKAKSDKAKNLCTTYLYVSDYDQMSETCRETFAGSMTDLAKALLDVHKANLTIDGRTIEAYKLDRQFSSRSHNTEQAGHDALTACVGHELYQRRENSDDVDGLLAGLPTQSKTASLMKKSRFRNGQTLRKESVGLNSDVHKVYDPSRVAAILFVIPTVERLLEPLSIETVGHVHAIVAVATRNRQGKSSINPRDPAAQKIHFRYDYVTNTVQFNAKNLEPDTPVYVLNVSGHNDKNKTEFTNAIKDLVWDGDGVN